jgi:ABC-type bacteriocin/lantibiotic exporter with double-glycine peptidase domain
MCGSIRERGVQSSLAKHLRKEKKRKTESKRYILCTCAELNYIKNCDEESTGLSAPNRAISMQALISNQFKSIASENSAWRKYLHKIGEREDSKQRNIGTPFLRYA